jgi:hypothetical protein
MTRAKVGSREAWALLIQAVVRDVQWHVWDEYVRDGLLDILNRPEVHGDDSYVDRLLAELAASPKADEVAAADAFINVISAVLAWRDRTRGAAVSHRALTVGSEPRKPLHFMG